MRLDDIKPFLGLLIFGNIENLVLSAQGVIEGANPLTVAIASIIGHIRHKSRNEIFQTY